MCPFVLSFYHVNPRIRLGSPSLVAITITQCAILLAAQKLSPEFRRPAPMSKTGRQRQENPRNLLSPLAKADELQAQQETCCQSKTENDQERRVSTTACVCTDLHTSPHMHIGQDEAEASLNVWCMSAWVLYKRTLCAWS